MAGNKTRLAQNRLGPLVYRDNHEIGEALGVAPGEVVDLVKNQGLPAFKIGGRGKWKLTQEDAETWLKEQAQQYKGVNHE